MSKRFRSGTFVQFKHNGRPAYGVVRGLIRTRYSVLALTGAGKHNGVNWSIPPCHLTYIPKGRVPDEVTAALAAFTLIGRVPSAASRS